MANDAEQEKAAIRETFTRFINAVKKKDLKTVASFFAANSVFMGAAGTTSGRDAILRRFKLMFTGRMSNAVNKISPGNIQMLGPGAAVVGGTCLVQGVETLAGQPVAPLKSGWMTTMVKQRGKWLIASQAIINESASAAAIKQVAALSR